MLGFRALGFWGFSDSRVLGFHGSVLSFGVSGCRVLGFFLLIP